MESTWTKEEKKLFDSLKTPDQIQAYLDSIDYSADPIYRSPRSVIRDRKAHCSDGALFAACALRQIGFAPLIIDLRAENDDDHIIALFSRYGHIGAIAKSNFVGLRFREPIFRNLRELALSYFEDYYNLSWEKTLRSYSSPLDLSNFDDLNWMTFDENLEKIIDKLDRLRHYPLLTKQMQEALAEVDPRSREAGMFGINQAGVYIPE
ncbi:MAG: hypothetical protein HUU50_17060 [Candidatus Brocadiae bacterium]|nr:hypothetical protein [Candidatus Brocadiia bacterium]